MANDDEQFHIAGLLSSRKGMVASERTSHSFNIKAVKYMQAVVFISFNLTPEYTTYVIYAPYPLDIS